MCCEQSSNFPKYHPPVSRRQKFWSSQSCCHQSQDSPYGLLSLSQDEDIAVRIAVTAIQKHHFSLLEKNLVVYSNLGRWGKNAIALFEGKTRRITPVAGANS